MARSASPVGVALVAPAGLLRSGVAALLGEHGYDVVELGPDDRTPLLRWWDRYGPSVAEQQALATVEAAVCLIDTADTLPVIDRITRAVGPVWVMALTPPDAVDLAALALSHGASSVAMTGSGVEELLDGLRAARHGMACVPLDVARSLSGTDRRRPDDEQLSWLQQLAAGSTVAQVARKAGYAERSFYRRLRQVYALLGATSRTDALLQARRQGLL